MKVIGRIILILIALVVIAGGAYSFRYMARFSKTEPMAVETSFKVGSLNAYGFQKFESAESSASFIRYVAEQHDIDILCLQEVAQYWNFSKEEIIKIFSDLYKYVIIDENEAILSKYPVEGHTRVEFEQSGNFYSMNGVRVGGSFITIINTHLQSTGVSSVSNRKSLHGMMQIKTLMSANDEARLSQAAQISEAIESAGDRVIVAGDFNSVPGSKIYNMVGENLNDSFLEKGHGWGATYKDVAFGLLRIDYIFHSDRMECCDFRVLEEDMSDHKAVVAKFRKP